MEVKMKNGELLSNSKMEYIKNGELLSNSKMEYIKNVWGVGYRFQGK